MYNIYQYSGKTYLIQAEMLLFSRDVSEFKRQVPLTIQFVKVPRFGLPVNNR